MKQDLHQVARRRGLRRPAELSRPATSSRCAAAAGRRASPPSVARVGRERVEVWRARGHRHWRAPVSPTTPTPRGCGWPVAFTIDVDPAWPSGFYEVSLHAEGEDGEAATSEAFFVVRPSGTTRLPTRILVLATNTYNAYNQWGGKCLYSGAVEAVVRSPAGAWLPAPAACARRGCLRRPRAAA